MEREVENTEVVNEIETPVENESSDAGESKEAAASAPEGEASTGEEGSALEGSEGEGSELGEQPAFTPNLKFKVMDSEHEVPELLRGLIVDEKSQKEVIEILEKAYGLDHVKPKHETLRSEHRELKEKWSNVETGYENLQQFVKSGKPDDFREFVKFWGIPKEILYQYAAEELQFEQAPPEVKAQLQQQREREEALRETQRQVQFLQQSNMQQAASVRKRELADEMAKPEVGKIASDYDAKFGAGAFQRKVIEKGQFAYQTTRRDLPASEAVKLALADLTWNMPAPTAQKTPSAPAVTVATQKKLPVIPNVGSGRGASPVKKQFTSIEDLKKHRQALYES